MLCVCMHRCLFVDKYMQIIQVCLAMGNLSGHVLFVGLAWTANGGEIMFVEATRMSGRGKLVLTGQLGKHMYCSKATSSQERY